MRFERITAPPLLPCLSLKKSSQGTCLRFSRPRACSHGHGLCSFCYCKTSSRVKSTQEESGSSILLERLTTISTQSYQFIPAARVIEHTLTYILLCSNNATVVYSLRWCFPSSQKTELLCVRLHFVYCHWENIILRKVWFVKRHVPQPQRPETETGDEVRIFRGIKEFCSYALTELGSRISNYNYHNWLWSFHDSEYDMDNLARAWWKQLSIEELKGITTIKTLIATFAACAGQFGN